jgi:hypothetical protein
VKDIFFCPEESKFYSHCLERMVLSQCCNSEHVIEFGSGDGSPVINSLLKTRFKGLIHGFELNASAWKTANSIIEEFNLCDKYVIHNQSFFDSAKPEAEYLWGGTDGSTLTKQLLSLGYDKTLLLISSFSDPEGTINHAIEEGYYVSDFVVVPLPFGYYSSEPKVKNTIEEMRKNSMAFYSDNIYCLAGVLFQKSLESAKDLSSPLVQLLKAL